MRQMIPFIPRISNTPLVSVIRLSGVIAAGASGRLNDAILAPAIERAFRRGKPRAVALIINSPGGSPVQSSLIAARIRRLADEHNIPVHGFVEDVAASGGYWLASAADDIWADPSSIIGSIGVISASFGFDQFIRRQGIERRVYTAGESKSMLDPFQAEDPDDVARLKALQTEIHQAFISQVQSRRGAKLADHPDLFSGRVWVGAGAAELGLIDGIGHIVPKMKELYGEKTRFARYAPKRSVWGRFGAHVAQDAIGALEERASYARFGL